MMTVRTAHESPKSCNRKTLLLYSGYLELSTRLHVTRKSGGTHATNGALVPALSDIAH